MTDFEINKAVAARLYGEEWWHKDGKVYIKKSAHSHVKLVVDYCNNPADAWPIIVSNKIGMNPSIALSSRKNKGEWNADSSMSRGVTFDDNPLRAAMRCFLQID